MKFARMYIHYKYKVERGWSRDGNIGDAIQNLAVENIYAKAGIPAKELLHINRDELNTYQGENCHLIMQSWFGDSRGVFPLPWNKKITPIFLGFHITSGNHTRERFISENIHEKIKAYEPIGCRDRNTRDFLKKNGIDAYFSGCMTLTFDKRTEKPIKSKIFAVDIDRGIIKRLPKEIVEKADFSISHIYYWNHYPLTDEDAKIFEQEARHILERYKKEATLIITSKIHVAMPCIAMGIPVVFITENPYDIRFDVLRGILPIYSRRDIKYIDWTPNAPDITELKQAIIDNAVAQIKGINNKEALNHLISMTEQLQLIQFLPKWVYYLRQIKYFLSKKQ